MTKRLVPFLVGLGLVLCPGCGRKGPLILPQGGAPQVVEGLTAVQEGSAVVLEWTNPGKTVAGHPLEPLSAVEIWVFERGLPVAGRALASADVEKTARLVRRIPREEFGRFGAPTGRPAGMSFPFVFDPGPAGPKTLAFTVRVFDIKGRASDFSAPAAADIVRKDAPIDRPATKGVC
jgi:hypothetical protein